MIGIIVGVMPGAGGNLAGILGYSEEKRTAADASLFGKGEPRGIAASECANNADNASSLIPTLALGVPGNSVAALMMGAMLIQGLNPGPGLFASHGDVVHAFMWQMMLTAFMMLAFGFVGAGLFVQMLRIPPNLLAPMILTVCSIGTYGDIQFHGGCLGDAGLWLHGVPVVTFRLSDCPHRFGSHFGSACRKQLPPKPADHPRRSARFCVFNGFHHIGYRHLCGDFRAPATSFSEQDDTTGSLSERIEKMACSPDRSPDEIISINPADGTEAGRVSETAPEELDRNRRTRLAGVPQQRLGQNDGA